MPYYQRNIIVLSATIFLAALSWNQIIPFLPLLLKQMGVTDNLLQWSGIVFAAQAVASILAQPFWGKMGDSYGRKRMVLRAGFCLTAIYFGMSYCSTPLQLAIFRFLNGALTGFIPGSMILIATNTPQEHAPRAVATAQSASAAGLIIGPALGGLLATMVGYQGSMRVSGAAVLVSTLLVWWLVQEPTKSAPAEKTSLLQDFAVSVRSPVMTSIMFVALLQGIFGAAITPVLTIHLGTLNPHAPDWLSGLVFSLPAAAFLVSARPWSRFGERRGFDRAILLGMLGGAAGACCLAAANNVWVFAVVYFGASVWLAAISPSAAATICTAVEDTFRGRAYGMQSSAAMVGSLVGPLVATNIGAALGIRSIFVFLGAAMLAGAYGFHLLSGRKTASQ